jgi:hypothetical protein
MELSNAITPIINELNDTDKKVKFKNLIMAYLDFVNGKLYGDPGIGYKVQLNNGTYEDVIFGELYDIIMGNNYIDPVAFIDICEDIKTGDYNW